MDLAGPEIPQEILDGLKAENERSRRYWTVKTFYPNIDEVFHGFRSGQLVGIGGNSAVGKSALALNLAVSMAEHGTKVFLFSFEMTPNEVMIRLLNAATSMELSMAGYKVAAAGCKSSSPDFAKKVEEMKARIVREAKARLGSLPLEIIAESSMTAEDIRLRAQCLLRNCDEAIIIIDCLQLIQSSKELNRYENDDERLDSIVISLKQLAMGLSIPVIVVTHLNQTDDLSDALPLAYHADIVMFLDPIKGNKELCEGWSFMEVRVAKFRQGPTGETLQLIYSPKLSTFLRLDGANFL